MKIGVVLGKIAKVAVFTVIGVLLLLCGVLAVLYSPWTQRELLDAVRARFGRLPDGSELAIGDFSLRFPMRVEVRDVSLKNAGDTIAGVGTLEANINPLGFLIGHASLRCVHLSDGLYRMGSPDSAMYLTIRADSIYLAPGHVTLADMGIHLTDAYIGGGRVDMELNADTTATPASSEPTTMAISLNRLDLNDFGYSMRMMPTIDTLEARIGAARLDTALIDLGSQKIALRQFRGTRLNVRYIVPDSAAASAAASIPAAEPDTASAAPWTITIGNINFSRSEALYATAGIAPLPGLDFGDIQVRDMNLAIRDFLNRGTTLRVPLTVSGTERCGVTLTVDGRLDIDSVALAFNDFTLHTAAGSQATFSGLLGMGDMATDPALPLALNMDADFESADIASMFPAATPIAAGIPEGSPVEIAADIHGTTGDLAISSLRIRVNRCATLEASGRVSNFMQPEQLNGDIALRGNIVNVTSIKNNMLPRETASQIAVPPMSLRGNVHMNRGTVNGNLAAITHEGEIRMNAVWNSRLEKYTLHAAADRFPMQAFMPLLGLENVSATADIDGRGYSPFLASTELTADATVSSATFKGVRYSDITARATLHEGHADLYLNSDNNNADLTLTASGNLDGDTYNWTATLDGRNIDLYALGFSPEPNNIELTTTVDLAATPKDNSYRGHLVLNDLYYRRLSGTIAISGVDAHLQSTDSLTNVDIANGDLYANFNSPCGLDSIMASLTRMSTLIDGQIRRFDLAPDSLRQALPPFTFSLAAGHNNLVNDILAPSDMSVRRLHIFANNDSTMLLDLAAQRFATTTMTIDSLFVNAAQADSTFSLIAGVNNQPGNLNEWHRVRFGASVSHNVLTLKARQNNLEGRTGFDVGAAITALPDTTFILNIKPTNPTIGYFPWTVNDSNYVRVNIPRNLILADLHMQGDNSSLAIYTRPKAAQAESADMPETDVADNGSSSAGELVIELTDIHVQDWISFNPFAPPMKGDVSADLRLSRLHGSLVGDGRASINNFTYGRERVADMEAEFDVTADRGGRLIADIGLLVDGVKTITVRGALNDSTASSPFDLDFSMIRFPLATVNPFMPTGTAKLHGMLNGTMTIKGSQEHPIMNGWLDFDSTAVDVAMLGSSFTFSEDSIPVVDNVVHFNGFSINGVNENPLTVTGTVDISDLANVGMDLTLKARNTQLVNSRRAKRGADVYGKAFINLDASVRGSMTFMSVDATARILPETNVTYVVPDAQSAITNRSEEDMVKFVNFTDSLAMVRADSLTTDASMLLVDATLIIDNGSILNVDLNSDGTNKVQIQSNGRLNYNMTPMNNGRLTGQLNIDGGFARYGMPPVLSEQLFTFDRGSYVAFRGEMMNPVLNIHATNIIKANVTQSGANSRLVNFNVSLGVTGTLDQMDVAFNLSTNDDIAVANELQGMSAEQRANQAMNLMLYHVYTGPGTKGNASLGNPLYTFLAGQLNQWAANTIKGVDVSFGIDQYDRTVGGNTSQTTSYSYQVSKSLFNDRFKIVVGGNYSTDANVDENFSQNLINDISFEYYLNRTRSMYVRLFRHTGYESILEGEITQTGVGFVYRRQLRRVGDMFLPAKVVRRRIERENSLIEQEHQR